MQTASRAHADSRHGLFLILFSAMLWGTVGITTKALYGLADTTPLSIGFFRLALAVPVLVAACRLATGPAMFRVARRDLGTMIVVGAMTALYQVCYFAAIRQIGVAAATLVTLCTAPVIVALLSAILTGERPSGRVLLSLACALAGTALLVGLRPLAGEGGNIPLGIAQALGSAFSYAAVTVASRTLAGRYHPLQPVAIGFAAGALFLLPTALADGLVLTYPAAGWVLLLYLGVVPTALAYALFLAGMRTTTATAASICTLLEPLVSTVLAWLIFGERLGPLGAVGAVLLFGAIGLLARPVRRRQSSAA
ncbi:DMT family transporter [Geobacter sulfurreducens]|uniref:DMT family transporter n=1 Tax=Geobacter sulfurreducens TaxID=35554 RepID=UPI0001D8F033|nr:EamA family transporter [Geobacter sulfurreducens]ADI83415.1 membrane protein, putative [Geobacter sulfurreducens KN400]